MLPVGAVVIDDGFDRGCYLLMLWWLMMGVTGNVTCWCCGG